MNSTIRYLLAAVIILLVPFLYMGAYETQEPIPVQAQLNIGVMNHASLAEGLSKYPKTWPPLYPALLWSLHKTTPITAYALNVMFFCASIFLAMLFTKKYIDNNYYIIPAGLFAINNIFYYNASVITSEMLMVVESLFIIHLLARHIETPKYSYVVLLGLVAGVMCYTRYFGLIWVFPTTLLCLFLCNDSLSNRVRYIFTFGLTSFVVSASWVLYVWASTGYLTGMDRAEQRELPATVSFIYNIIGTFKTATYDLLSPQHIGDYAAVLFENLSMYEHLLFFVVIFLFGLLFFHLARLVMNKKYAELIKPKNLPAIFFISYLVVLNLIWSVGNNDPIYTRFIYPVYPVFFLAVYSLFVDTSRNNPRQKMLPYALILLAAVYVNNQFIELSNLLAGSAQSVQPGSQPAGAVPASPSQVLSGHPDGIDQA
jgi:hypothetical protein